MDAASCTGVDDMREVFEAHELPPHGGAEEGLAIDEVHMLSRNAFDALLKTLEEPPPHVKFALATTELRKVPVTCSRAASASTFAAAGGGTRGLFRPHRRTGKRGAEPAALDLIARAADGSVRDGLSLDEAIARAEGTVTGEAVTVMLGLSDREAIFDPPEAVPGGKPAAALAITERADEHGPI